MVLETGSHKSRCEQGHLLSMSLSIWCCSWQPLTFLCLADIHSKSCHYMLFPCVSLSSFFQRDFIYLFSERGEGREKEKEKNIDVQEKHQLLASHMPPTVDLARNPAMCPDREWNWLPFSSQAATQLTSHTIQGSLCLHMAFQQIASLELGLPQSSMTSS